SACAESPDAASNLRHLNSELYPRGDAEIRPYNMKDQVFSITVDCGRIYTFREDKLLRYLRTLSASALRRRGTRPRTSPCSALPPQNRRASPCINFHAS